MNSISSLSRVIIQQFFILTALSLTKSSWWYWISYGRARMTTKKKIKCFFIIDRGMMLFSDRSWNSSLCGSKVPKIFMITTFRFSRHKSRTIFCFFFFHCLWLRCVSIPSIQISLFFGGVLFCQNLIFCLRKKTKR